MYVCVYTADKFIIKHLKAIEQNTTLFKSKQPRHDMATENTSKNSNLIIDNTDIINISI